MIRAMIAKLLSFLTLGVVNTSQYSPEVDGALIPAASLIPVLNQLANNAAPGPGDFAFNAVTSASQLTAAQVIQGLVFSQVSGAVTHTLPSAAQIIAQLPGGGNSTGSVIGRSFLAAFYNTNTPSGVMTIANSSGSGITLSGTFTVAASYVRWAVGQVTSATAVTLTSLGQSFANAN